jgi:fibronectin-binding autotransporter adhesin
MFRRESTAGKFGFANGDFGGASKLLRVLAVGAALVSGSTALAATVVHTDDDAANTAPSGFSGAMNWFDGGAPTAGNDYVVQSFLLRTLNTTGNFTFQGDSLTLQDGGELRLKNNAGTDIITTNNLIMDAGIVRANSNTGATPSNLAGAIKVTTNGATFSTFDSTALYLNLTANVSDASGSPGGAVSFGGNDQYSRPVTAKRATLAPTSPNAWTGSTNLIGGSLQLGNANALPSGTTVYFGSGMSIPNSTDSNGASILDLNGQSISLAGIAVQSYTASSALLTGTQPVGGTTLAPPANTHSRVIRVSPIAPGTVKVGQLVTGILSTGSQTPAQITSMVTAIYNDPGNTYTDITLGDNSQFSNVTLNLSGLSFGAGILAGGQPLASQQVIGNGSQTSDATLTITGSSTFAGNIVDVVAPDPNVTGTLGNKKTNIAFTANGGTLTLNGANTYGGTTTLSGAGSTLALNYASNVTYAGIASGVGNVSKGRSGTLTLTGINTFAGNTANVYTGNTIVDGGTLAVDFTTSTSTNVTYTISTAVLNPSTLTLANVANGTGLVFTANAPGGTAINTPYFVVNSTGTTVQVATTPGGSPLTLTTGGGNLSVSRYDRAANIINNTSNSSALVLSGGTFQVKGGGAQANSQRFNGLTLSAPSGITLTTNAVTNTPAQAVALNVGAITRNPGGVLLLTNPSGTLSATNGLQVTNNLGASATIVTAGGTPYIVVGGNDWGANNNGNDPNHFVVGFSSVGTYFQDAANHATVSGNTDIVGSDYTLASGGSATSIRFNDFAAARTVSITSGTLQVGGILVTNGANTGNGGNGFSQTIAGGTLQAPGAGQDLVLVENNTKGSLIINSAISDNTGSGLATAGVGTVTLGGANTYTGNTYIGGTLNLTAKQAFYSGTVSAANAAKVTVNTGATLGLSVGGSQFTAGDVGTILSNANFKYGSTLALDTTGGSVALGQVVTDAAAGANRLGLTKNGTNDLTLFGGNNTYTGATTINKGFVRLASGGSLSGGSNVTMAADASTGLDINGGTSTVGVITGGAAGSTVALGSGGTLNIVSTTASGTNTYSGQFTGSGIVNVNIPGGVTQVFGGAGVTGITDLSLINGQLTLQAPASSTWGSATTTTSIGTVPSASGTTTMTVGANTKLVSNFIMVGGDAHGDAITNNPAAQLGNYNGGTATLNINQQGSTNTTSVVAKTLVIGPLAGVGTSTPNQTVNIGTNFVSGGNADVSPTVELQGTVFTNWGNPNGNNITGNTLNAGLLDGKSIALAIGTNNTNNSATPTATLNIAGASTQLKIEFNSLIVLGRYYGRTNTINQSGGSSVTFYTGDGNSAVGGTGGLYFDNDNSGGGAGGTYRYNLNGGTLTTPVVYNAGSVSSNPTAASPNGAMLLLTSGTLAATGDSADFITGIANHGFNASTTYTCPPIVRIGVPGTGLPGPTLELNGHAITINAGIFHDPNIAAGTLDGGLTIKSTGGAGTLTLNPLYQNAANANTGQTNNVINQATYTSYTGPTTIQTGVTLVASSLSAINSSSRITVNGGAKLDVSAGSPGGTIIGNQILSGRGTIHGSFSHQIPTSTISPGTDGTDGIGTFGTLTFDTYLELVGGKTRFDLSPDAVAGPNDQIVVTGSGQSFAAAANPSTSVVQCELPGNVAPSSSQVYHLVSFPNGTFSGNTQDVLFNGTHYDTPTGLTLASAGNLINGRDSLLAVNSTTHSLDLVFHFPAILTGNLFWTGASSTAWDTNNSANWNNVATNTNPDKFFSVDKVTFDNTAGPSHLIVQLTGGGLAPSSVTVNSSSGNDFTFNTSGGGKISGPASLTKDGTSTLTINAANDYTGGTDIKTGLVVLADPGTGTYNSGLGVGTILVEASGQLQIGNGTAGLGSIAVPVTSTAITNNGSITFNRPDPYTLFGNMTGTGTFAVTAGGTVTLMTASSTAAPPAQAYSGNTTITGSTLVAGVANAFSANSVYHLSNIAGSVLNTGGFNQSIAGLADGGTTGGTLTSPGGGTLTFAGNSVNTFSGALNTGTTAITVNGALTGGVTNLDQTLAVSASTSTGTITVTNGILRLSPAAPVTFGASNTGVNIGTAAAGNNGTL